MIKSNGYANSSVTVPVGTNGTTTLVYNQRFASIRSAIVLPSGTAVNAKTLNGKFDSVDVTTLSWLRENVTNTYIGYDQRHFNDSDCVNCPNKCSNRIPGRKTIQELLMGYSKYNKRYGTGHTVAIHCLSLAILLGCTEIYLFGIDLNYSLGYVDNKTVNNDSFSYWLPEIIEDFKIINESAKNLGINIYNTSKVSPLKEIFENKTTL
jgi:hypothetical protein